MEDELARLIAEQRADNRSEQRPERHGSGDDHGLPVLSHEALGLSEMTDSLDSVTVSGKGLGAMYDEAGGPGRSGRYVQQRLGALWGSANGADNAQLALVRAALAEMTEAQRETFRLVFGERLSYREAAAALGIDVSSVRDRVDTLKRIVTRALVSAAGGDA